jgi:hypothetical protein
VWPSAGPKSGEKALRALLRCTPEWCDAHAREAAAVRADACDMPELGAALRKCELASLRKRHFFALCRDWRLRSDLWRHVRDGSTGASPPPLPPPLSSGALAVAEVSRELMPLVVHFAHTFAAQALFIAAAAEPLAPIKTLDLTTLLAVRGFGRDMRVQQSAVAASLRAASAALAASGDGDLPACRLGKRAPPSAECSTHAMLLMSLSMTASNEDAYAHAPTMMGRTLSGPEVAHLAEHADSCGAVGAFAARAGVLLARMRVDGTCGVVYLDAAVAVVEQIIALMDGVIAGSQGRLDMFKARLAIDPHGYRHSFFDHAETAGVAKAAQHAARLPVSVQ